MVLKMPDDLITSAEAAKLTRHSTAWAFVRFARNLGLREFERKGTRRLLWSKAEILERCFTEKSQAS
jgi:hypothetical protein